jgi:hypothetical protein
MRLNPGKETVASRGRTATIPREASASGDSRLRL